jgi:thiol:disulfide interchange protein DsbD
MIRMRSTSLVALTVAGMLVALASPRAHAQSLTASGAKQAAKEPRTGEDAVKVSWAVIGDAKPGATVRIAATYDIVPNWHIYWLNAGESGAPTEIELELPEGCAVAKRPNGRPVVDFPVPKVFRKSDTTFGYEGTVTLSVAVTLPATIPASGLAAKVRSSWLVCKEMCLLGRNESQVDLLKPATPDSAAAKALAASLALVPKPLPGDWKVSLSDVSAESAILVVEAPASVAADAAWTMLPAETPGIFLESGYMAEAKGRSLRVPLVLSREISEGRPLVFTGVVDLGKNAVAFAFSVPVPNP